MKSIKAIGRILTLLVLSSAFSIPHPALLFGQAPAGTNFTSLGPGFRMPYVTGTSASLIASYTAGSLNLGHGDIAVATGTVTTVASRSNCQKPTYSSCNIVYATSSGTVSNLDTTTFTPTQNALLTISAAGNSILAFVETNASGITAVSYPWTDSSFPAVSQSGAFVVSTGSITPAASPATIGVNTQTFTVTGIVSGDLLDPVAMPTPTALCPLVSARATATNTVALDFSVMTAAACTPAAGTYKFLVIR